MAITLRTVTGSALSHTQLDTNFSSYFYSASVSASVLDLYYTGSSAISLLPRSTSLNLPSSSKWTDVAGGGISRNSAVQITGSTNISGSTNIVGTLVQGLAGSEAYNFSHAEGYFTIASASYSHAEGYQAVTSGSYSHAEGRETSTAIGAVGSHAEGYQSIASGSYSHAEGNSSVARGQSAHSEGYGTIAIGPYSHAEGNGSIAQAQSSHAEGRSTLASASYSHAEGESTITKGGASHAEGLSTITIGDYSHAEGYFTSASGDYSHAEGYSTKAVAQGAHAEGQGTLASASYSHAEGQDSQAKGIGSHAEGYNCFAIGQGSHAEGYQTQTDGAYSHTEGVWTKAAGWGQTVVGHWNLENSSTGSFIIGNGTSSTRSNLVFASGSTFQVTGSLNVTGSLVLNSSNLATAWTSYTPTWTGTSTNPVIGDGTITGAYKVIGKTCFVRGRILMGSTTTYGSGAWLVGLPFTASNAYAIQIPVSLLNNATAWYSGLMNGGRNGSSIFSEIQVQNVSGTADGITGTFPFTWGSADEFAFNGSYEIA